MRKCCLRFDWAVFLQSGTTVEVHGRKKLVLLVNLPLQRDSKADVSSTRHNT